MRRFSQRNSLVTLNEINITPLLDLAFVLLIIFVITRPMLEQSMQVKLPDIGKAPTQRPVDQRNIKTVEISANGVMRLSSKPATLQEIEAELVKAHRQNTNLIVNIRADKNSPWDCGMKVMGVCQRNGITQVCPQTAPEK